MELEKIHELIINDPHNQSYTSKQIPPVYQVSPDAKILIIGQAPGSHVAKTFIPFNDKSGEKLMQWLRIDKNIFYSNQIAILPMDFYYPGKGKTGDLPPRKFISEKYHHLFLELMPQIQLTILTGKYAIDHYLKNQTYKNLTETVYHYQEYLPEYFPIVHPSPLNFRWHAKNPWFEQDVIPVLQQLVNEIIEYPQ